MYNPILTEAGIKQISRLSPISRERAFSSKSKYIKKKLIKRPSTLFSLQTNLLNSINYNIHFKPKRLYNNNLNFEEYSNEIYNTMQGYQLITPMSPNNFLNDNNNASYLSNSNNNNYYVTQEDETEIKRLYDNNRSFISRSLSSLNEDSMMKINIQSMEYLSPYQSIGVLKNNQVIYDKICKNYLMRQKFLFDNSIKEFEGYAMKFKTKMPKIRILPTLPKLNGDIPVVDMVDEKKKKTLPLPPINKEELKFFCYYRYPNKNFPEGRDQFSLCVANGEIVIIGGVSSAMKLMPIWSLNLEKFQWKKIIPKNFTHYRFGHTCCSYQNKLYIFGGRTKYLNTSLIADLEIFNFNDLTWNTPILNNKNGPQLRRNHIAILIGQQMLIHGGITESNEILSDCFLLNLNPLKWMTCSMNPYTTAPKVYGHAASLAIPSEVALSHRFNIYKMPEMRKNNIKEGKIKEKGLFVFGGKGKEEGGVSNEMWVLLIGEKPLEWMKVDTKGKAPSPRYMHTMEYYEKGNFLIVHGGRNDDKREFFTLGDTFLFDLENFEWLKVTLYSNLEDFEVISRCGHKSIIFSNKLIILGGMNDDKYLGSSLFMINLDFYYLPKQSSFKTIELDPMKKDINLRDKVEQNQRNINNNQPRLMNQISLPLIGGEKKKKEEDKKMENGNN